LRPAAGISGSGIRDHIPVWARDDDELGVHDGAPSWQRSGLDPVGARAERATAHAPAEANPVHPAMPGNTETTDSSAIRRYLDDHELHGRGSPEAEDKHRLPASPGTCARDPVAREVQPVDARPA
jgi:hypothetical protein